MRGCARDGCARERVRVRQYRVICEALKFEFSLLKLEFLRLGFTLVNRVSDTRDLRVPTSGKETEPQRLDFGPGNRASEARVANNIYSF